jgi:predicted TIM-barrel enzyme
VLVKHARTLSIDEQDLDVAIEDTALRAGADAVIISGASTGRAVAQSRLERAGAAARAHGVPLYIGSGSTAETLPMLLEHAYGVIVGSALRQNGEAGAPLDSKRIRAYMKTWSKATSPRGRRAARRPRKS